MSWIWWKELNRDARLLWQMITIHWDSARTRGDIKSAKNIWNPMCSNASWLDINWCSIFQAHLFCVEAHLSSIFDVQHALALIIYSSKKFRFHIWLDGGSYGTWCIRYDLPKYNICFILYNLLDAGMIEVGDDAIRRGRLDNSLFRMISTSNTISIHQLSHPNGSMTL